VNDRMLDRVSLPAWPNVAMLGYYTLVRNSSVVAPQRDTVIRMANALLAKSEQNAFNTVMGQTAGDYAWGGNSNAANQGILLIYAYNLTKDQKYLNGAISNLDYILGRNATGYSFITGIGSKTPMHPHHRQSEADGIAEPVPGLMVGGPNLAMQDKCNYLFKEIETAYTDDVCSYASNEIAINWQASIVYLANAIEAIMAKTRGR
jgi:endoglucanase